MKILNEVSQVFDKGGVIVVDDKMAKMLKGMISPEFGGYNNKSKLSKEEQLYYQKVLSGKSEGQTVEIPYDSKTLSSGEFSYKQEGNQLGDLVGAKSPSGAIDRLQMISGKSQEPRYPELPEEKVFSKKDRIKMNKLAGDLVSEPSGEPSDIVDIPGIEEETESEKDLNILKKPGKQAEKPETPEVESKSVGRRFKYPWQEEMMRIKNLQEGKTAPKGVASSISPSPSQETSFPREKGTTKRQSSIDAMINAYKGGKGKDSDKTRDLNLFKKSYGEEATNILKSKIGENGMSIPSYDNGGEVLDELNIGDGEGVEDLTNLFKSDNSNGMSIKSNPYGTSSGLPQAMGGEKIFPKKDSEYIPQTQRGDDEYTPQTQKEDDTEGIIKKSKSSVSKDNGGTTTSEKNSLTKKKLPSGMPLASKGKENKESSAGFKGNISGVSSFSGMAEAGSYVSKYNEGGNPQDSNDVFSDEYKDRMDEWTAAKNQETVDKMDFNEAFPVMRESYGPNHTFEWRGKQYTTETADDKKQKSEVGIKASYVKEGNNPLNISSDYNTHPRFKGDVGNRDEMDNFLMNEWHRIYQLDMPWEEYYRGKTVPNEVQNWMKQK